MGGGGWHGPLGPNDPVLDVLSVRQICLVF